MARLFSARTLILGGLAAGAAYALRNNTTVKGLLGGGSSDPEPYAAPSSASVGEPAVTREEPMPAPAVANVDVAGPPENTATHVPAPEPVIHEPAGGIDEAAEEAAAAAEAANIGGVPEKYPSEEDSTRPADEATRPLEEAGEGYAEGQELAEADLIENAEPAAGDPLEGGRAIDDAIEAQDDPFAGEAEEGGPSGPTEPVPAEDPEATLQMPLADAPPPSGPPATDVPPPPEPEDAPSAAAITPSGTAMPEEATPAAETSAGEKGAAVWRIEQQDTVEQPVVEDPDREAS
jgi:hypothetical protein